MANRAHLKSSLDFYQLWKHRRSLIKCGIVSAALAFALFLCTGWKTEYTAMLRIEPELSTTGESTSIEEEMSVIQAWATISDAVQAMQRTVIVKPAIFKPLLRIDYYLDSVGAILTGRKVADFADFQPSIYLDKFIISGDTASYIGKSFYLKSIDSNSFVLYDPQGHRLLAGITGKPAEATLNNNQTLTILVNNITPAGSAFRIIPVSEEVLTGEMQSSLKVSREGFRERSGLMKVTFSNPDPLLARQFLGTLVKTYLAHAYDRSAMGKINGLAKLKQDSVTLRQRLAEAEGELAAFKEKNDLANFDQAQDEAYKRSLQIRKELRDLENKRKQLSTSLTNHHPTMIALSNQIIFYQDEMKRLQKGLGVLSAKQPALDALQNNVAIAKTMLDQNTSLAAQLQATVETITGYAQPISLHMERDMSPLLRSALVIILGFLIGMLLAAAYFMINMVPMLARIHSAHDLAMASTLPVVAELQLKQKKQRKKESPSLNAEYDISTTASAERQWERLEHEIQFLSPANANKILLFTSIDGHDGPAICAQRIASASAKKRKTLLIDANIMQPALYKQSWEDSTPGLSDLLTDHAVINDVVQPTSISNLFLLPAGAQTPNYRLLADAKRMQSLLTELSATYERIIIAFPALTPDLCRQDVLNAAHITFVMVKRGTSVQELSCCLHDCNIQLHQTGFFILN